MARIKKAEKPVFSGRVKKATLPDDLLRFSFKYFDGTDEELCPSAFPTGYTRTLMERLRDLSSWTVSRFQGKYDKALRNHTHDWPRTTRPDGFANLNEQLQAYPAWQFQLSSNQHGRVHGFIIDNTFYVIWLDVDHKLYD
jgi:hypothetical protein